MNEGKVISKFVAEVKKQQAAIAQGGMLMPKRDLFSLGETSGNYQGLQKALDILDSILRDTTNEDEGGPQ